MDLNRIFVKRAAQGTAVVLATGMLIANAAQSNAVLKKKNTVKTAAVTSDFVATAGVSAFLHEVSANSFEPETITYTMDNGVLVSETAAEAEGQTLADTKPSDTDIDTPVDSEWENRLMTTSDSEMNVRIEANTTSQVVGKLRKGDVADIVKSDDGWYKISSGNVEGYVREDLVVTGDEAKELAMTVSPATAISNAGGLRVRSEASEDSSILTTLYEGQKASVDGSAEIVEGWTAVKADGESGYVKSAYVTIEQDFTTAITIEEEQAAIAAAKAAAEEAARKAAEAKAKEEAAAAQNKAINKSADDQTIIAAVIQCEAGNQPYDGMVAVGATIVNRVNAGRYGGSVQSVVYAKNQYYSSSSSKLAKVIANGPNATCMQAAADALAGVDPTGGKTSYRPTSSGRDGVVIAGHVFF